MQLRIHESKLVPEKNIATSATIIGPGLLLLAVQATETKVRRSTGVPTANLSIKNPNANKLSWAIN